MQHFPEALGKQLRTKTAIRHQTHVKQQLIGHSEEIARITSCTACIAKFAVQRKCFGSALSFPLIKWVQFEMCPKIHLILWGSYCK